MNDSDAVLIATSCTTGWSDWIHGALWMDANRLVRIRLSLAQTRERGRQIRGHAPAGGPTPAIIHADTTRPGEILAGHKTNKVIEFSAVARMRLHHGRRTDRINILLTDGTRHKLLWLPDEPAFGALHQELPGLLGQRFAVD